MSTLSDLQSEIHRLYKEMGSDLLDIALKHSRGEIKRIVDLQQAIRYCKRSFSQKHARLLVEEVSSLIVESRCDRNKFISEDDEIKSKHVLLWQQKYKTQSLARALEIKASRLFEKLAKKNLNLTVSGAVHWRVSMVSNPAQVSMSADTFKDWDLRYGGYARRWAKTSLSVDVKLPRNYLSRVYNKGLSIVDGIPTLDAFQLDCTDDRYQVYAARWVEMSRGKSVKVVSGFIAASHSDACYFHALTYKAAVSGLLRKLELVGRAQTPSIAKLARRFANENLYITLDDARETGSCEFGIKNWCYRSNLPYEMGKAPAKDVIEAYHRIPMPEARRAILHAGKRLLAEKRMSAQSMSVT